MVFSLLWGVILYFLEKLFSGFSVSANYENFMGGLNVWSYGVHVLGAPLFYLIMGSVTFVFVFKTVFAVINWIWQQLPLT